MAGNVQDAWSIFMCAIGILLLQVGMAVAPVGIGTKPFAKEA